MVLRPRPSTGEAEASVRGSGETTRSVAGSGGAVRTEAAGSGRAARTIIPLPAAAYQVFEVADLTIPAGTDWSLDGHVLGTLDVPRGVAVLMSLYIEVDAPLADGDDINVGEWPTPGQALGTNDWAAGLRAVDAPDIVSKNIALVNLPNVTGAVSIINNVWRRKATPEIASVQQVGIFNSGPSVNPITVVHARAAFLVV